MTRLTLAVLALTISQANALPGGPNIELKDGYYELNSDDGGELVVYSRRFNEIERSGLVVKVTAMCSSACTLVLRNPKACAMPKSVFGFHQAWRPAKNSQGREKAEAATKHLWSEYPQAVREKVGQLTPDTAYIRGTYLIPACNSQANAATYRTEPAAELKNGRYELSADRGGYTRGYDNKFREIERSGLVVRVKDICSSACTIVLRNPKACAERGALFGFHQTRNVTDEGLVPSERDDRILWSYYPDTVKAKVGELKPDMVWIKGTYLIPACK